MEAQLCQICDKNPSKYVCPRCGVPYCSLPCYKNENKHLQCSESFYKECVVDSLKSEELKNPETAKKMREVLERFNEQYNQDGNPGDEEELELDSDDDEPLEQRLSGVDLNNADEVWKHLSEDERREFQSFARNMDAVGDIIPEWVPWWNEEPEKKLIVEISEADDAEQKPEEFSCPKLHKSQPDIFNKIPKMSELTRVKPNQHVAHGLLNVICAYIWTSKLFNGDLFDPCKIVEVCSSLIHLSSFLRQDTVFKNVEHAMADVPMNALQIPALAEGGTAIQHTLSRDVWIIVKGPKSVSLTVSSKSYLLSSLTECYKILLSMSKAMKTASSHSVPASSKQSENSKSSFAKLFPSPPPIVSVDLKLVSKAKRKLLYLLAFANEFTSLVDGCSL